MVLGSFGSDLMRERRDLERRADSSISNLMDYSHRSGDFTTSSCMYKLYCYIYNLSNVVFFRLCISLKSQCKRINEVNLTKISKKLNMFPSTLFVLLLKM